MSNQQIENPSPEVKSIFEAYVTDQQDILGIMAGNMEAVSRFYSANHEKLRRKVTKFVGRLQGSGGVGYRHTVDDCMQQLFLDMPYLDYADALTFARSVSRCCQRTPFGGIKCKPYALGRLILDSPVKNGKGEAIGKPMLDLLVSSPGVEDVFFNDQEEHKPLCNANVIKAWLRKYLPQDTDYKVVCMRLFSDLTDFDIDTELCISRFNTQKKAYERAIKLLIHHYADLVALLNIHTGGRYEQYSRIVPASVETMRSVMRSVFLRRLS